MFVNSVSADWIGAISLINSEVNNIIALYEYDVCECREVRSYKSGIVVVVVGHRT